MRAQRKSPEHREDGGGGGGPLLPSRGVTLARPPAALGGGEGDRNASPQAQISPPSPVPGTRGQRPAGWGPGSRFRAAHSGVRGRAQQLPPLRRRADPCLVFGLSFLHGGIRIRGGPEQSRLLFGPVLVLADGATCVPSLNAAGSLIAPGPSAPSAGRIKKWNELDRRG